MKGRILISEEEKRRILQMHKSLLSEQIEGTDLSPVTVSKLTFSVPDIGNRNLEVRESINTTNTLSFTITPTTAMTENSRSVIFDIQNSGIAADLTVKCVRNFDSTVSGGNGTEYKTKSARSGSVVLKNYNPGTASPVIDFLGRDFQYDRTQKKWLFGSTELQKYVINQKFSSDGTINTMIQNYCSAMCGSSKTLCSAT